MKGLFQCPPWLGASALSGRMGQNLRKFSYAYSFIYDFVRFLEFLKKLLKYSKRKVVSLHSRSYKLRSEI